MKLLLVSLNISLILLVSSEDIQRQQQVKLDNYRSKKVSFTLQKLIRFLEKHLFLLIATHIAEVRV